MIIFPPTENHRIRETNKELCVSRDPTHKISHKTWQKTPQKILVIQQNNSGESKISGIRNYGKDLFELEVFSIDEALPPVIDNSEEYLPENINADLVLDFLKHPDLSLDLAKLCADKKIPLIASGKKMANKWPHKPPT